jgi:two-component system cell cycle sensor histidine kinase/response regulator CckA
VEISVTDIGIGMDEETCQKIFDPFFTTKEMGRGTGLGLSSAYGIIKHHYGFIDVHSEVGCGTTFHIYLPGSDKDVKEDFQPQETALKGTGAILLVDDEDMVTDVGRQMLEKLGYKVLWWHPAEGRLSISSGKTGMI